MNPKPSSIVIRPAVAGDALGVARVHIDSWRTTYRGIVPEEVLTDLSYEKRQAGFLSRLGHDMVYCVAEDAEAGIVGFANGGPEWDNDPAYKAGLYSVYILQEHQRRGIGRMLVQYVAGKLVDAGLCSMLVWVLTENRPARRFYEGLGGKTVRTKRIQIGSADLEEMAYGWADITPLLGLGGRADN